MEPRILSDAEVEGLSSLGCDLKERYQLVKLPVEQYRDIVHSLREGRGILKEAGELIHSASAHRGPFHDCPGTWCEKVRHALGEAPGSGIYSEVFILFVCATTGRISAQLNPCVASVPGNSSECPKDSAR